MRTGCGCRPSPLNPKSQAQTGHVQVLHKDVLCTWANGNLGLHQTVRGWAGEDEKDFRGPFHSKLNTESALSPSFEMSKPVNAPA